MRFLSPALTFRGLTSCEGKERKLVDQPGRGLEALVIVKMAKRGMEVRGDSPAEDSDLMKITPLGSGQEVVLTKLVF